jgi:hypothetical protein
MAEAPFKMPPRREKVVGQATATESQPTAGMAQGLGTSAPQDGRRRSPAIPMPAPKSPLDSGPARASGPSAVALRRIGSGLHRGYLAMKVEPLAQGGSGASGRGNIPGAQSSGSSESESGLGLSSDSESESDGCAKRAHRDEDIPHLMAAERGVKELIDRYRRPSQSHVASGASGSSCSGSDADGSDSRRAGSELHWHGHRGDAGRDPSRSDSESPLAVALSQGAKLVRRRMLRDSLSSVEEDDVLVAASPVINLVSTSESESGSVASGSGHRVFESEPPGAQGLRVGVSASPWRPMAGAGRAGPLARHMGCGAGASLRPGLQGVAAVGAPGAFAKWLAPAPGNAGQAEPDSGDSDSGEPVVDSESESDALDSRPDTAQDGSNSDQSDAPLSGSGSGSGSERPAQFVKRMRMKY